MTAILEKGSAWARRTAAAAILWGIYNFAWVASRLLRRRRRKNRPLGRCILLIGTFDNRNWFHAHVRPIVSSGADEIVLVCDDPIPGVEAISFCCPPKWAARLLSRAVAKLLWSIVAARRFRPDICIGYHIFPAGVISLVVGRLFGCKTSFQVTSGQLELEGGGWHGENRLLVALGKPSKIVERAVLRMLLEFDLVVVRGEAARAYVENAGFGGEIAVITASVAVPSSRPGWEERDYDIVFVGRLTEYKRPDRLIEVLAALAQERDSFRAAIIGDGPDEPGLRRDAESRGLDKHIDWIGKSDRVFEFLSNARIFILTSRWEGVSIAMLEAMASGCVPVVSDVGDLRDFVANGETGYLVPESHIGQYAKRIDDLLGNPEDWERLSRNCATTIENRATITAISARWREAFQSLSIGDSSGVTTH